MIQDSALVDWNVTAYLKLSLSGKTENWNSVDFEFYRRLYKPAYPKTKIINIEDELVELCLNTDNTPKNRKLFYNDFFINKIIKINHYEIRGILVSNTIFTTDKNMCSAFIRDTNKRKPDGTYTHFCCTLNMDGEMSDRIDSKHDLTNEELKNSIMVETKLRCFVANIIDFVEHQKHEYVQVETHYSSEQDQKRIDKSKSPIHSQVYIKLNQIIKTYATTLGNQIHYNHKFVVRGHWRHFNSDRYRESKGKSTWIKPFIKGQGILVNKEVTVQQSKEMKVSQ